MLLLLGLLLRWGVAATALPDPVSGSGVPASLLLRLLRLLLRRCWGSSCRRPGARDEVVRPAVA